MSLWVMMNQLKGLTDNYGGEVIQNMSTSSMPPQDMVLMLTPHSRWELSKAALVTEGTNKSTHSIILTSGFGCRMSRNLTTCNAFFFVVTMPCNELDKWGYGCLPCWPNVKKLGGEAQSCYIHVVCTFVLCCNNFNVLSCEQPFLNTTVTSVCLNLLKSFLFFICI